MTSDAIPDCRCGNSYLAIRTDIYKDGREFIYCDCCGALADRKTWQAAFRPAPEVAGSSDSSMPVVAWRDPSNSWPAQGCTYNKADHERWPHIYAQALVLQSDALKAVEEARAKALEEAAAIVDQEEENAREERYSPGLVGSLEACAAQIRSLKESANGL